ncbi:hypothetical protein IT411_01600 [Candidatus Peregrinibacteria bacterium]|nr:hypothetical protein [Candidatus Peregrinibacteria bacterium]
MKKPTKNQSIEIPFAAVNLQKHLERAFDLWTIKNPSAAIQFQRSSYFILSLLLTIFWPIQDNLINSCALLLIWILTCLNSKNLPRLFLLSLIMLTIVWIFSGIQYFTNLYQNFLITSF